jgi:Actin interacting protein 3
MSIPDDLRDVLERCLSEDATPENLELYLPKVRAIITNLLQGLRTKQSLYRARATDRSSRSRGDARTDSTSSRRGEQIATASEVEEPRSARTSGSSRSGRATPGAESSRNLSARSKRSEPSGSSTRRAGNASESERWVGGFVAPVAPTDIPVPPVPQETANTRPGLPRSPSSRRGNTPSSTRSATPGPDTVDGEAPQSRQRATRQPSSLSQVSRPITETEVMELVLPAPEPPAPVPVQTPPIPKETAPPEMKRYSLSDRPTPAIEIADATPRPSPEVVDASTPPPETPSTPGVESSLAALKSSEALQRRASKRFSTYTFSKMAGGGGAATLGVGSGSIPRKSLAAGSILTPGDLAALTEADEDGEGTPTKAKQEGKVTRKRSTDRRRMEVAMDEPSRPPVPPMPDSRSTTPTAPVPSLVNGDYSKDVAKPPTNGRPLIHVTEDTEPPPTPPVPTNIGVFLQVLRQVKKVTMEPPQSFGALRVLFVDKFAYNPGQDNFPAIYIRDPSSGVQYELEDVSEVKDKCLLSLNIERKCHILTCEGGFADASNP